MERKIGETFEFEGHKLKVVDKDSYGCDGCDGCFFLNRECCSSIKDVSGFCSGEYRTDKKRVIFVEAKDEQPQELNLCEILKNCPKGFKLYSVVYGEVTFLSIKDGIYPICVLINNNGREYFSSSGKLCESYGECLLFPSKEQRDWSKFTAPWFKRERFDPKTLKPFDKVLVRSENIFNWNCSLFSNIDDFDSKYPFTCLGLCYRFCIPYNDDTKHLVGTTDEAPDFYKYWED